MSGTLLRRGARALRRAASDPDVAQRPMVATHTTESGTLAGLLQDADAGLLAPSIGISTPEGYRHLRNFGDMALIVNPDSIDPRRVSVYARDAYTPRRPGTQHEMFLTPGSEDIGGDVSGRMSDIMAHYRRRRETLPEMEEFLPSQRRVNEAIEAWRYNGGLEYPDYPHIAMHALDTGNADRLRAAADIYGGNYGRVFPRPMYNEWARGVLDRHGLAYGPTVYVPGSREGILPATDENILRAMDAYARAQAAPRSNRLVWRGAEDHESEARLAAAVAPTFRNWDELQGARGRLLDDYQPSTPGATAVPEWERRVRNLYADARGDYPSSRAMMRNLREVADLSGLNRLHGLDPPDARRVAELESAIQNFTPLTGFNEWEARDILLDARNLPTGYFEAKPRRRFTFGPEGDFVGAVVPSYSDDVADLLRNRGLHVVRGNVSASTLPATIRNVFGDQFFSAAPLALTTGGVAAAARGLLPGQDEEPLL